MVCVVVGERNRIIDSRMIIERKKERKLERKKDGKKKER